MILGSCSSLKQNFTFFTASVARRMVATAVGTLYVRFVNFYGFSSLQLLQFVASDAFRTAIALMSSCTNHAFWWHVGIYRAVAETLASLALRW